MEYKNLKSGLMMRFLRATASIILLVFIFNTIVWADPSKSNGITVPRDMGKVRHKGYGSSGKTIIHIQDAHSNFGAQLNIARIINYLARHAGVGIIGIEGAVNKVSTGVYRSFPYRKARNEVAYNYVKKGLFSGSEYSTIFGDITCELYGLENKNLFDENLGIFKNNISQNKEIDACLIPLSEALSSVKSKTYNERLRGFDERAAQFEAGKLDVLSFLEQITAISKEIKYDLTQFKQIELYKKLYPLSIIYKPDIIKAQTKQLAGEIEKMMRDMRVDIESERQITRILRHQSEILKDYDYQSLLYSFAELTGFDMGSYKMLSGYLKHMDSNNRVDFSIMEKELRTLIKYLRFAFAKTEDERDLLTQSYTFDLWEHTIRLQASREEADYFVNHPDDKNSLNSLRSKYPALDKPIDYLFLNKCIDNARLFYKGAFARDSVLVDNLIAKMEKDNADNAVLVAGGFHSEGIKAAAKVHNVDYVEITPALDCSSVPIPYTKKITGGLLPYSTSNITLSLIYDDISSSNPKLRDQFESDAVLAVISLISSGQTTIDDVIAEIESSLLNEQNLSVKEKQDYLKRLQEHISLLADKVGVPDTDRVFRLLSRKVSEFALRVNRNAKSTEQVQQLTANNVDNKGMIASKLLSVIKDNRKWVSLWLAIVVIDQAIKLFIQAHIPLNEPFVLSNLYELSSFFDVKFYLTHVRHYIPWSETLTEILVLPPIVFSGVFIMKKILKTFGTSLKLALTFSFSGISNILENLIRTYMSNDGVGYVIDWWGFNLPNSNTTYIPNFVDVTSIIGLISILVIGIKKGYEYISKSDEDKTHDIYFALSQLITGIAALITGIRLDSDLITSIGILSSLFGFFDLKSSKLPILNITSVVKNLWESKFIKSIRHNVSSLTNMVSGFDFRTPAIAVAKVLAIGGIVAMVVFATHILLGNYIIAGILMAVTGGFIFFWLKKHPFVSKLFYYPVIGLQLILAFGYSAFQIYASDISVSSAVSLPSSNPVVMTSSEDSYLTDDSINPMAEHHVKTDDQYYLAKALITVDNGRADTKFWTDFFHEYPEGLSVSYTVTLTLLDTLFQKGYNNEWGMSHLDALFNGLRANPDRLYEFLAEIPSHRIAFYSNYFATLKPGIRQQVFDLLIHKLRDDQEALQTLGDVKSSIMPESYIKLKEQTERLTRLYARMAQTLNHIRPLVGEALVKNGLITEGQFVEAIWEHRITYFPIEDIIIRHGWATKEQIDSARASYLPSEPPAVLPSIGLTMETTIENFTSMFTGVIRDYSQNGYQVIMPSPDSVNVSELVGLIEPHYYEFHPEYHRYDGMQTFFVDNRAVELLDWVEEITNPANPNAHYITEKEILAKAMELHAEGKTVDLFKVIGTIGHFYKSAARNPTIILGISAARAYEDGPDYIRNRFSRFDYAWVLDPHNNMSVDSNGQPLMFDRPVNSNGDTFIPEGQRIGIKWFADEDVRYHSWGYLLTSFYIDLKSLHEIEKDRSDFAVGHKGRLRNPYVYDPPSVLLWNVTKDIIDPQQQVPDTDMNPFLPYLLKVTDELSLYDSLLKTLAFSIKGGNNCPQLGKLVLGEALHKTFNYGIIELQNHQIHLERGNPSNQTILNDISFNQYVDEKIDNLRNIRDILLSGNGVSLNAESFYFWRIIMQLERRYRFTAEPGRIFSAEKVFQLLQTGSIAYDEEKTFLFQSNYPSEAFDKAKLLKLFIYSPVEKHREWIVEQDFVTADMLKEYISSDDIGIKKAIAYSPHATEAMLSKLALDTNPEIRENVAENKNTTPVLLDKLTHDPEYTVRLAVAYNQNTSLAQFLILMKDPESTVRVAAVKNPNATEEIIKLALSDKEPEVRLATLFTRFVTEELVIKLANDNDPLVLNEVVKSEKLPIDTMMSLVSKNNISTDVYDIGFSAIKNNSKLPFAGFMVLLTQKPTISQTEYYSEGLKNRYGENLGNLMLSISQRFAEQGEQGVLPDDMRQQLLNIEPFLRKTASDFPSNDWNNVVVTGDLIVDLNTFINAINEFMGKQNQIAIMKDEKIPIPDYSNINDRQSSQQPPSRQRNRVFRVDPLDLRSLGNNSRVIDEAL